MKYLHLGFAAIAVGASVTSATIKTCPPLGIVLPPAQAPSSNEAVTTATKKLTAILESKFSSQLNSSGISLVVKSTHEDVPLFTYHFTPPVLSGIGTTAINENTIFRVGSLSKLFPALAALQTSSIHMDDLVLKYIPEFKTAVATGSVEAIPWDDITVDSLMTHLSGLATDTAMDLGVFPLSIWQEIGLPEIPEGTGPNCSGLPGTVPCTKQDLVNELKRREPIYLPYTTPSYSNVGFAILGMVIDAAINETYINAIQNNIFDVVGMNSSSFNGFVDSFPEDGFVPVGETTWNATLGVFESAGGMFSTTADLIAFAEGILMNRFLSARRTREWMKPRSHTSSWGYSVGAPWEILRTDQITADGRIVDLYTKSGDLGLYHALLGLVPDYDISIVVFAAGAEVSSDTTAEIFSAVTEALIPAIDEAGKTEAVTLPAALVGTYTDKTTNSSLILSINSDNTLTINRFTVRSFDVLHHASLYSLDALSLGEGSLPEDTYVDARLYPTNLVGKTQDGIKKTSWRAVYDTTTAKEKSEEDAKLVFKDGSCQSWTQLDRAAYNYLSIGDFLFSYGSNDEITHIRNAAFNVTLAKAC
ncbi:beta-lactamase/transpeptidase-like protein [Trichoderma sp. SZMC 28012]